MAKFPALPLFTDAYLADTRHLTTLQHGAYLLLLMTAWRTADCCLPNDDDKLSRWAGLDKRTWKLNKDTILSFWKLDVNQNWRQGRLEDERNYVEQLSNINSVKSKARWLINKKTPYAAALPDACRDDPPTPTPTPTPITDKPNGLSYPPISPLKTFEVKNEPARKNARALPNDWQPNDSHRAISAEGGFDCEAAATIFRDWAIAGGKRYHDWDATFRNALRGWLLERLAKPGARAKKPYHDGRGNIHEHQSRTEVAAELAAELAASEPPRQKW